MIRYIAAKSPTISSIKGYDEYLLPKGIIERGKIVDRPAFNEIMTDCVKKWQLKYKEVKFFVPDSSLFFRKLTIPSNIPDDDVRGYLNFEIGSNIHLPFEDAYFDFQFLTTDEENEGADKEILFFATPEPLIREYQEILEKLKLRPIVADVSSLCIHQLYSTLQGYDPEEHYLFVEWDLTSINLSIFQNHLPVFMRHIPLTMGEEDWEVEVEEDKHILICKNEERILMEMTDQLSEIERVMNFYKYSLQQGEKEITTIVLVGDHPMLSTIKERMSIYGTKLNLLTEKDLGLNSQRPDVSTGFVVPLSLCLKEVSK